ncbi:MAG: hypothetical protein IT454_01990 [Planctomycetes bacterium]|nr:hypothetical protein [Planctomycetota bacterium]
MSSIRRPIVSLLSVLAIVFCVIAFTSTAKAHGNYYNNWNTLYPNSTTDNNVISGTGQNCALCHFTASGGANWNAYGWKMRELLNAGQSVNQAIQNSASFNSDLDPTNSSNLAEINASSQPGWTSGPNNTRYNTSSTVSGQLPLASILGNLDPCGSAINYCTAGTSTNGCSPSISMVGISRASLSGSCTVMMNNVEGAKQGLIFYGLGRNASPWGTSTSVLCVKAPTQRMTNANSGGTAGACDGQIAVDIHAWWAANPNALGQPLAPGLVIDLQGWFRDPPSPKTTNLSNALETVLCP